ncbi:unnamed protein product [Merluccius merluccius]
MLPYLPFSPRHPNFLYVSGGKRRPEVCRMALKDIFSATLHPYKRLPPIALKVVGMRDSVKVTQWDISEEVARPVKQNCNALVAASDGDTATKFTDIIQPAKDIKILGMMELEDGRKELLLSTDEVIIVTKAVWDQASPDGLPSMPWHVTITYDKGEIVEMYGAHGIEL